MLANSPNLTLTLTLTLTPTPTLTLTLTFRADARQLAAVDGRFRPPLQSPRRALARLVPARHPALICEWVLNTSGVVSIIVQVGL